MKTHFSIIVFFSFFRVWDLFSFDYLGLPGEKGERGIGSPGPRGLPGPPGKFSVFN